MVRSLYEIEALMRYRTRTVILLSCVLRVAACGSPESSDATQAAAPPTNAQLELITPSPSVEMGQPVIVNLAMRNDGDVAAEIRTVHDVGSIYVRGPDGNPLPYVGMPYQSADNSLTLKPGETITLRRDIDLTTTYLFETPGAYTVLCRGTHAAIHDSPPLQIVVRPGILPPVDACIARMLDHAPEGWQVYKHYTRAPTVTPARRHEVPGGVLYVSWKSSSTVENRVTIWLTDEKTDLDAHNGNDLVTYPKGASEYWGESKFGHVYVYLDLDAMHKSELAAGIRVPRDASSPNRERVVDALRLMLELPPRNPNSPSTDQTPS